MATVKISFNMDVDDNFINDLQKIVDHKLEQLVDLDSFPEIDSIYEGEMEVLDD